MRLRCEPLTGFGAEMEVEWQLFTTQHRLWREHFQFGVKVEVMRQSGFIQREREGKREKTRARSHQRLGQSQQQLTPTSRLLFCLAAR
ncbi:hypothetical protein MPTK1_2g21480 [Marchantia polymorpha subsp. ruderalis]|uniref:Uncharacterized protein n=1 Tax=Marchantia polymorpha TaxID=3197 RepID=A0A2R6X2T7_MARPO|nr:hypothetical protein MARPO_0040s0066 [Marchantia polymorpha]BBN03191.1 hypothetical protein Mp_2g21480 [Marchantia polymorpha subsp. ruderalis]|eukprot:PTQ40386.1 hypothetical protein MARPO_0040s0066 [Marchantia polymorpha]